MSKTTTPFAKSNPAFEGSVTEGSAGEHSTTELPTEHKVEADHAQFDEHINGVGQDPNLTGSRDMADLCPYRAGEMTGWQENDDYREYFEATRTPESALRGFRTENDGDYDDNGGYPTALGHSAGYEHASDRKG